MPNSSRKYTAREEIFNVATHLPGIIIALAAWFILPCNFTTLNGFACIFYPLTLLFMFGSSSLHHLIPDARQRQLFRKFDHCAIYLLITGTYAPLMAYIVPDWRGAAVMSILGILTVLGIILKFCRDSRILHRIEVGIYLLMGWLCVMVAKPLIAGMSRTGLLLLLAGGLAYTFGVIFYAIKKEFFHAVWHIFVLAGAILQLLAILTLR